MEDIPQPANAPYERGQEVMVYLAPDDEDAKHHGKQGRIVEKTRDTLGEETGRELDSYSYRIETEDGKIGTWFRHRDLVPVGSQ